MKSWLIPLAALVFGTAAHAAQPLLSPAELQPLLEQEAVRVIDIRPPADYTAGHLPGAVNAPYGSWRGPAENPGELPELSKLTALIQGLGLTPESHAVIVSSGANATDFGAAARVYWTLKVLGLSELSILNGGTQAWVAAQLPLAQEAVAVQASTYQPQLDATLIATRDEVVQRTQNGGATLLDARPKSFFEGETRHTAATLPGTLPGAVNLEHDAWFQPGTSTFVTPDEARKIAGDSPFSFQQETVSFCNTGHWAATNWFALSEVVGQPNVKLYAGSMVDWTHAPEALPMDNVPGRAKQLMIDAKLWAETVRN